ncbi:MAG: type IV toxin-antitoxin system AbiEi family antitoxin domain-containing protein [Actinomycetes bacterium]
MSTLDLHAVVPLAQAQGGAFTLAQAERAGISPRTVLHSARAGLVEQVHPGVYRFPGAPVGRIGSLWAAHLYLPAGARLSHESALVLHGVRNVPVELAATLGPDGNQRVRGVRVHRLCDLGDEHCATVRGLPTTTLDRALVDVASVVSKVRLGHLVDQVTITDRSTSVGRIARTLRQVNRRGRKNITNLVDVLNERSPGEPAPRSSLEQRFDALIAASGLPAPRREHPVTGADGHVGLVDRFWPEADLVGEVDGRVWHSREAAMAKDRARDRAAAAQGLIVLRFLDQELDDCPELVVADLVATYRRRMADRPKK